MRCIHCGNELPEDRVCYVCNKKENVWTFSDEDEEKEYKGITIDISRDDNGIYQLRPEPKKEEKKEEKRNGIWGWFVEEFGESYRELSFSGKWYEVLFHIVLAIIVTVIIVLYVLIPLLMAGAFLVGILAVGFIWAGLYEGVKFICKRYFPDIFRRFFLNS